MMVTGSLLSRIWLQGARDVWCSLEDAVALPAFPGWQQMVLQHWAEPVRCSPQRIHLTPKLPAVKTPFLILNGSFSHSTVSSKLGQRSGQSTCFLFFQKQLCSSCISLVHVEYVTHIRDPRLLLATVSHSFLIYLYSSPSSSLLLICSHFLTYIFKCCLRI